MTTHFQHQRDMSGEQQIVKSMLGYTMINAVAGYDRTRECYTIATERGVFGLKGTLEEVRQELKAQAPAIRTFTSGAKC